MTLLATETTIKDLNTCTSSNGSSLLNTINTNEKNSQNDKVPSPSSPAKKPKAKTPLQSTSPATVPFISPSQFHASSQKTRKKCRTTKKELKKLEASKFISEQVHRLHPKDVLFGRGNGVANFSGNSNFRALICKFKPKYNEVDRKDKKDVARLLMNEIFDAGGRFLEHLQHQLGPKEDDKGFVKDTFWTVSNHRALEKTCQALREKKGSYCPSHLIEKTTPKMTKKKTKSKEASVKAAGTRSTGNGNTKKSPPSHSLTSEATTLSAWVDQSSHSDFVSNSPVMKCNRIMDKGKSQAGLEKSIVKKTITGPGKQPRRSSSKNNDCSNILVSPGRRPKKMRKVGFKKLVKQENHSTAYCSSGLNDARERSAINVKNAKKYERSNYSNSSSASIERSCLSELSQPSCTHSHATAAAPPVPENDDAAAMKRSIGNTSASAAMSALKVPATSDILSMVPPEFEKFYSGALLGHCEDMLNRHGHVKPTAPTRLNQKKLPSFSTLGKVIPTNAAASLPNDDNTAGPPGRQNAFQWNEAREAHATDISAKLAADGRDNFHAFISNTSIPSMERTHETETISWEGESSKRQASHPGQFLTFRDTHCIVDWTKNQAKDNEDFMDVIIAGEVASLLPSTEPDVASGLCPTALNYFFSGIYSIQEEAAVASDHQVGKNKGEPQPVTPDSQCDLDKSKSYNGCKLLEWIEERDQCSIESVNDLDDHLAPWSYIHESNTSDFPGHVDNNIWMPFATAGGASAFSESKNKINDYDNSWHAGMVTNHETAMGKPEAMKRKHRYSLIDDDDDETDYDHFLSEVKGDPVELWRQATSAQKSSFFNIPVHLH